LEKAMNHVFVVSDGSGGTAERTLRAALTQFPDTPMSIELRPEVRSEDMVAQVVEEVVRAGGFIAHTIVSRKLRNAIGRHARLYNVEVIDLLGPLLARLSDQLSDSPLETPGLFRNLNKEYFRRIEAMEFVFRHDDGQRVGELSKADIVLVGVSRTFKTPISMYLAFKGWMVGNVPIILDLKLPPQLFELPPAKVFGLTTDAHHLAELRRTRHDYLGGATGHYADFEFVCREIEYARGLFHQQAGWRVVEVTNKPIEEIATEILDRIRRTGP
jgi:regulator of PEP synthase PpsR (kinase-PPPase family)